MSSRENQNKRALRELKRLRAAILENAPSPSPSPKTKWYSKAWGKFVILLSAVSVVVGVPSGFAQLYPFISVATSSDSLPTPHGYHFLVTNDSALPITKVKYVIECWETDNTAPAYSSLFMDIDTTIVETLESKAGFSALVDLPPLGKVQFKKPFLQVWVTFQTPYVPWWTVKKGFRFWARSVDGNLVWYPAGSAQVIKNGQIVTR